ncbi:hypothetical protein [Luteimonas sp. MC1895]|uniref:hypothetical protein n=1 Tax=Luteimonas sp. MC1895 TaxID=2819513 RepID=UPI0018F068A4|nr:hypothetical protein [Luteimonas sp. MC1895]MBJ6979426.1 hypothetical protein [Luteimonas sp. MC1895]
MRVPRSILPSTVALAVALATASCATPREVPSAPGGAVAIEGTVASIDTQPWMYDGHAVVQVEVAGRGRVSVQLPARWNLCKAAPVDVQALAVGMRVQAVGAAEGADALTVCSDTAHRLVPLGDGGGATRGGDGSGIVLVPLSAMEIDGAALAGELACSFSAGEAGESPLLLAKGDVASSNPARGVVKVGDHVETVAVPGGFDAMLHGTRFSGSGKTIDIALTGAATGGGESPARPGVLTYLRADGAERTWSGWWQCGP